MKKKTQSVLLIQKVKSLGEVGQVVNVKAGFSRNYLLPFKLGKLATVSAINEYNSEHEKSLLEENLLRKQETDFKNLLENLKTLKIKKEVISNTTQLFGKITINDILTLLETELKSNGLIERQQIELPLIQNLGEYEIKIHLNKNVSANLYLNVIAT